MDILDKNDFTVHDHSGGAKGKKLNASNVEVNSNSFKIVKESRLDNFLLKIEELVDTKVSSDGDINKPLIMVDGKLKAWEFDEKSFANMKHDHSEYFLKTKGKNGNIPTFNGENIIDSNLNIENIATKQLLEEKVKQNIEGNDGDICVINNNKAKTSGINIKDISGKDHTHDYYVEKPGKVKGEVILTIKDGKTSTIENDFSKSNHTHNDLIKKIESITEGNLITYKNGEITDLGINIKDLATKTDLLNKSNTINGEDDYVLTSIKGQPTKSSIKLNDVSKINHTHSINDVEDFNLDELLAKSPNIVNLIDKRIKAILGKILL